MGRLTSLLSLSISFLYRFFVLHSDYSLKSCHFDQIYQFGDSLSDTGNFIREPPNGTLSAYTRLPYGQAFFKNATGRAGEGLLIIDYIAIEAGVPLLNPHYKYHANFTYGEVFAVIGATALTVEVLAEHDIVPGVTNSSLTVQLGWMLEHFKSTCYPDCTEYLSKSLFMLGEIGANDYNLAFRQGKALDEVEREEVPAVINVITNTIRKLINIGAVRIVVPGMFPLGCFPIQLTLFSTNDSAAYDDLGCLRTVNDMLSFHNEKLQEALLDLKREFPHTIIVYGDYYNPFLWLFKNAKYFGFDPALNQQACCGIGGDYNFSIDRRWVCGQPGVPICPDSRLHLSWDGVHFTQEATKMLAMRIISDILPELKCSAKLDPISLGRKSLETKKISSI